MWEGVGAGRRGGGAGGKVVGQYSETQYALFLTVLENICIQISSSRERGGERQRQRETETERDRQTDRDRERHRERQRDKERERRRQKETHREIERFTLFKVFKI